MPWKFGILGLVNMAVSSSVNFQYYIENIFLHKCMKTRDLAPDFLICVENFISCWGEEKQLHSGIEG